MVRFLAKGTETHGPELSPAKMDLPWYFSFKRKMLTPFSFSTNFLKVGDRRLKCRKGAWSSTPPLCAGGNCDSSLIPQVTLKPTLSVICLKIWPKQGYLTFSDHPWFSVRIYEQVPKLPPEMSPFVSLLVSVVLCMTHLQMMRVEFIYAVHVDCSPRLSMQDFIPTNLSSTEVLSSHTNAIRDSSEHFRIHHTFLLWEICHLSSALKSEKIRRKNSNVVQFLQDWQLFKNCPKQVIDGNCKQNYYNFFCQKYICGDELA